ncbi:MAG TPA: T9SS type A sorting domain-containing protein [Chitinophagaceae bacterium]|nr:T9SS type A sorting domain-containing protein [Chitinophagaceae bacterium]
MMRRFATVCSSLFFSCICFSQSPGQIVRPAGGNGVTVLNPNGDGYISATTAGFITNDVTESEIPYKRIVSPFQEPTGDVATGPSGGFTDFVQTPGNFDFLVYSDGTNLLFRFRIGNIISGSKGYSILIDTDGKMGNSGPSADPNYVPGTNIAKGNPGFEYEAVLQTNFQVAVYNVDGIISPAAPIATYPLNTHAQISLALSTDGNNPDYFYDFYIPLSAIGSPASFRLAGTTVTSPSSAFQGSRSDIFGINDAVNSDVSSAWASVINSQPVVTPASIGAGGTGQGSVCTAPPVLNAPVGSGSNISVTGSWTRLDATKPATATITLYKNGVASGTTSVSSGSTWTIAVASIAPGDALYAKAVAADESECLQSNHVTAACAVAPVAPSVTCASTKGITGTIHLGSTIEIYQISTAQGNPSATPLTTGLVYTNNASNRTFNYYGTNPQSGNACQGQSNLLTSNTTYMMVTNNNGCLSAPTFICITGSSQNSWSLIAANTLSLSTPIYPYQTSVTGTGATTGQLLRLFINNRYITSLTATGSSFTFSGFTLATGDSLRVYAQASAACMTQSPTFKVSCYTQPPSITTSASGNLVNTSTSISGTSSTPGATIQVYRGTSPSGILVGTTTVNSNGTWTTGSLTLTTGETYYATQTDGTCTSSASASASVLAATTVCPQFGSSTYGETVAAIGGTISTFTGTVRLYLDGVLIGSTTLSNATSWSIAVNTVYSNTLYPGGILTATAQTSTGAENTGCANIATVTCVSPITPAVTPSSITIPEGQSVNFSISNVAGDVWYAVRDNTGSSYATSVYSTGTNNLSITTNTFNTPGTYTLTISADKLSGCPASARSAIVEVTHISLPVTFISASAREENGLAIVQWTVTNEQQVSYYAVERSRDGSHFETIGQVPYREVQTSENTYQFKDNQPPLTERYYYRIKQVDENGHFTYSSVLPVQSIIRSFSWSLQPNPAHEKASVIIQAPVAVNGTLSLLNVQGALLSKRLFKLPKGVSVHLLEGLFKLPAGTYIVSLETNGKVSSQNLIIR